MSTENITITGTTGPAIAVTSQVYTNVTQLLFDIAKNIIRITFRGPVGPQDVEFDYALTATITYTISAANGLGTVTIS